MIESRDAEIVTADVAEVERRVIATEWEATCSCPGALADAGADQRIDAGAGKIGLRDAPVTGDVPDRPQAAAFPRGRAWSAHEHWR